MKSTVVTAVSTLRGATPFLPTAHVRQLAGPALLLHRRNWLRTSWSSGAPAAPDDTAKDGEKNKTTDAAGNADHKVLVIVNPR